MKDENTEKRLEFLFVDKKTKKIAKFFRTLLGVYVRDEDKKPLSHRKLFELYYEFIPERTKANTPTGMRFCESCRLQLPLKEFHIGQISCRSCAQARDRKKMMMS